jgi:hypothetical protein
LKTRSLVPTVEAQQRLLQLASCIWQVDLSGKERSALALELRARLDRAASQAGPAHSGDEDFLELNFEVLARLLMLCWCGSSRHRVKLFQPQFTIRPVFLIGALWEIAGHGFLQLIGSDVLALKQR